MEPQLTISDTVKLLSDRIETEINRLNGDVANRDKQTDSLVFIGNWQDAIPRSIWVDGLLSAIDVRSWGVIRTQAVNGSAVILSLNKLLKDTLGYSNATVSRVIFILRLTRWISLCSKLRTETGKFRGNIYAIHDHPVSLEDAIYLDNQYIEFVKNQTSHSNNAIRTLAQSVWQAIRASIHQENSFQGASLTNSVYGALNQLAYQSDQENSKNNQAVHIFNLNQGQNSHVQKLNVDAKHQVQFLNVVEPKIESDKNQQHNVQVQNLNVEPICSSRCSSSSLIKKQKNNKTSTTNSVGISKGEEQRVKENLIYPQEFNANENKLADLYLQKIDLDLQQIYLDETAAIIKQRSKTNNPIRNPIGYLSWLCNEQSQGNTYLTSAYIKHQEQRERKETREKKIKQQQRELTQASLKQANNGAAEMKKQRLHKKTKQKVNNDRWGGVNNAVRPKNR